MPLPFEVPAVEIERAPDLYVDSVFGMLESAFFTIPKGRGYVEYSVFEAGYEALKKSSGVGGIHGGSRRGCGRSSTDRIRRASRDPRVQPFGMGGGHGAGRRAPFRRPAGRAHSGSANPSCALPAGTGPERLGRCPYTGPGTNGVRPGDRRTSAGERCPHPPIGQGGYGERSGRNPADGSTRISVRGPLV